jgi:hypothetical protein
MRLAVIFTLVASLAAASVAAAAPRSESDRVKAVIFTQVKLFKQGRYRAMYDTTITPRYRATCPWAKYRGGQLLLRRFLGERFTLRGVRVRMLSRRRALLAYRFVRANGQIAGETRFRDRDIYVKVGSRWLDEFDRVSGC